MSRPFLEKVLHEHWTHSYNWKTPTGPNWDFFFTQWICSHMWKRVYGCHRMSHIVFRSRHYLNHELLGTHCASTCSYRLAQFSASDLAHRLHNKPSISISSTTFSHSFGALLGLLKRTFAFSNLIPLHTTTSYLPISPSHICIIPFSHLNIDLYRAASRST